MELGRVHGSEGGVYRVLLDSGLEAEASLRGRLKRQVRTGDKVVIGDQVQVLRDSDGSITIEAVLPRRTQVVRRGPGGRRPKVVAANLDRLVVVVSVARPTVRQALIDRLLVVGESNGLEVLLVFNKVDILGSGSADAEKEGESGSGDPGGAESTKGSACTEDLSSATLAALVSLYGGLGYEVLETSATSKQGLSRLKEVLCQGTSALVGPSGVGKSSLLNTVQPGLGLRIGDLSEKKGIGRHTTVSGRLIPLECGGLVADTPGFSEVGLWGVEPRDLEMCFPEFLPLREGCRFRGCTHLHEPGCQVREALSEELVDRSRFESYRVLFEEAETARRSRAQESGNSRDGVT